MLFSTTNSLTASNGVGIITCTPVVVDSGLLIGPRRSWDPTAPRLSDAIRQIVGASSSPA